jgi:hypothetical protein
VDAKAVLIEVTPAMAQTFLGPDLAIESTHRAKVEEFAEAMRAGKWTKPSTILLSKRGRVVQGGHRLAALILADRTIPFWVRVE